MKTKKNPVHMIMMKKMMIVRRRRRRRRKNRYHERVPGHRGEKTLKDLCGTQLVDNPVIAVTVDYRLIEVEQHDRPCHLNPLWRGKPFLSNKMKSLSS